MIRQAVNHGDDSQMSNDLVEIASFQDYIGASIAKSKLESEGIRCFLFGDVLVTWNWFYSNAFGGVKVMVGDSKANEALAILTAQPVELGELDETAFDHKELACPECSCSNVHVDRIPRRYFHLGMLFGILAGVVLFGFSVISVATPAMAVLPWLLLLYILFRPVLRPKHICANCGYSWKGRRGQS